jgi:hypothetical protein
MHRITHFAHLMLRCSIIRIKPKSKVSDKSEIFDNTYLKKLNEAKQNKTKDLNAFVRTRVRRYEQGATAADQHADRTTRLV